ncbi:MAG TPA: hypothetical protein VHJ20_20585 [Polyangia bacterium]|nr:hypothetical protein [Polyangia bacterium]
MVRRVEELNSTGTEAPPAKTAAMGFAAKVIGIGVVAGLMLTYCNALIDACFRGIH